MAAASQPEAAEDELQYMIKTEPEQEGSHGLPACGHVPAKRDPVVPLMSPVSGQQPLAWSPDHRLSVCTASSLLIMEMLCDVRSDKQHLMLHRSSIPVPPEPCKMRVGPSAELAQVMEKFSSHLDFTIRQAFLTNRVINPSVGTHKGMKYASWSPLGCDAAGRCLLACLTLENRLSIHHSKKHLEWNLLVDLTQKYGELLKERGYARKDNKPTEANLLDFEELQRRFRMQTPLKMEWSSTYTFRQIQPDNTCVDVEMVLLAVLMENGDLVLWKFLLPFTNGKDVLFFDLIESGVTEPSDFAWWEYKSEDRQMSGLIIGSEEGPIKIIPVHLKSVKGYFTLRHPVILWKDCDNIAVENIRCIPLMHPVHKASCSLIVASRGCYIFWSLLVISPAGMNVHNSHIAGLHSLSVVSLTIDRQSVALYSCSMDGWIKKLTPMFQGSSLTFKQEDMPQVENLTGRRIHGIAVSPNGAYIALLSTQGLVGKHPPINRTYQVHFVTLKAADAAVELLLKSPSQNLYKMTDLLDLVRWDVIKNGCIPTWLEEALDQKLQEADVPYLWRFKLFLVRVLYQTVQPSRGNDTWKPRPRESQIAEGNEVEAVETEESESALVERERQRAELQASIHAAEAHLLRENMKKVLGVVYLNTSIGQNTSIPTCGLMEYLSRDGNDRASEVLIGHIKNKMNKQTFSERCAFCQAVLPFTDHKDTTCENGHLWPRCVLSYQACQTLTFRRCLLLDSIARLPEPEDPEWIKKILQAPCMLCDSPLIEN